MFGTNYKGVPIFYVKQDFDSKVRDKPWRTVDALCYAKKVIDCPFVVCNGDEVSEIEFSTLIENDIVKKTEIEKLLYRKKVVNI